eukprot:282519_1
MPKCTGSNIEDDDNKANDGQDNIEDGNEAQDNNAPNNPPTQQQISKAQILEIMYQENLTLGAKAEQIRSIMTCRQYNQMVIMKWITEKAFGNHRLCILL